MAKTVVVSSSVLIIGASVAFMFRKEAPLIRADAGFRDNLTQDHLERRLPANSTWSGTVRKPALRVLPATTAAISDAPILPTEPAFRHSTNPVGALLEPIENASSDESAMDPEDQLDGPRDATVSPHDGLIRHKIADGDTLSKLATTYLGSTEKYLEIFELNRDILTSPDLLPIGRELKIPPRRDSDPPAEMQPINVPSADGVDEPRLVPVNPR